MGDQLAGKVALIMGGSRGIGAAIAERLAADGADVAITYGSSADSAREVVAAVEAAGRRGLAIEADSTDPQAVVAAVDRAAAELGRLDILVNNAGAYPFGPIDEMTTEDLELGIALHVRAPFVASQAAVKHMREGGRIISTGTNFIERVPYAGLSVYAMTKAALVGLTKALARDLGERGISVALVNPGNTNTAMNPADSEEAKGEIEFLALKRYAEPKEIAATVAHLAGPAGAYVTGASITVDGGYNA